MEIVSVFVVPPPINFAPAVMVTVISNDFVPSTSESSKIGMEKDLVVSPTAIVKFLEFAANKV